MIATDGSGRRVQVSSTAEAIGFLKITRNNYYAALRENIPVNGESSSYQKKEPLLKDTLTGRVTLPPLPMLERWIAPPGFSLHEPLLALC